MGTEIRAKRRWIVSILTTVEAPTNRRVLDNIKAKRESLRTIAEVWNRPCRSAPADAQTAPAE